MIEDFYINDVRAASFGLYPDENVLTALWTPAPLKERVTNDSRLEDGTRYLDTPRRVAARDLSLTFSIEAATRAALVARYNTLMGHLKKHKVKIKLRNINYHLIYKGCAQYSEYNGRLARFVINFTEPNPNDHSL